MADIRLENYAEPLFTRSNTEQSATPFLPALSKCKPGMSLPISKGGFLRSEGTEAQPTPQEKGGLPGNSTMSESLMF